MASVTVNVVCKCGKLLSTKTVSSSPTARTSGGTTCPNCKRRMKYDIVGGKVTVYETGK